MQTLERWIGGAGFGNRNWVLLTILFLSGCAGPSLNEYRSGTPAMVPEAFFSGQLTARGVVKNFSGKVIRTFDADIQASWSDDGVGTLDETFVFDDGEVTTRVWTLTPVAEGYHAEAGDVLEPGLMRWQGNALHMNYVLEVPYNDGTISVRMDDWMYRVTPDTVINETAMTKWGVKVGEVVLVIQRQPPTPDLDNR